MLDVSSPIRRVLLRHLYNPKLAYMAYFISHLFSPTIPKAFRPRSSVLVLTIPTLVSKQFFLKSWYS
jgi:hypothetical protein